MLFFSLLVAFVTAFDTVGAHIAPDESSPTLEDHQTDKQRSVTDDKNIRCLDKSYSYGNGEGVLPGPIGDGIYYLRKRDKCVIPAYQPMRVSRSWNCGIYVVNWRVSTNTTCSVNDVVHEFMVTWMLMHDVA